MMQRIEYKAQDFYLTKRMFGKLIFHQSLLRRLSLALGGVEVVSIYYGVSWTGPAVQLKTELKNDFQALNLNNQSFPPRRPEFQFQSIEMLRGLVADLKTTNFQRAGQQGVTTINFNVSLTGKSILCIHVHTHTSLHAHSCIQGIKNTHFRKLNQHGKNEP